MRVILAKQNFSFSLMVHAKQHVSSNTTYYFKTILHVPVLHNPPPHTHCFSQFPHTVPEPPVLPLALPLISTNTKDLG